MMMKKILITGVAGFIGYHLAEKLLKNNYHIIGIDNLNDYYDPNLKKARLDKLNDLSNFEFHKIDFIQNKELQPIYENNQIDQVIHLGAQAGVRYSISNPQFYIDANITGFLNILENSKNYKVKNIIYASSSSVYGINEKMPFSEIDKTEKQISMYGVSKKTNEMMAHTYSNLYGLSTVGLRFFTVYGPWGRPDMAPIIFTKSILENKPIDVYNYGKMLRDFTYIDDIVNGICASIENNYLYEIFNLGNNRFEDLMDMISYLEKALDKKADIEYMDIQPGDVEKTFANIDHSTSKLNYKPKTTIQEGIPKFIKWYKSYHKIL